MDREAVFEAGVIGLVVIVVAGIAIVLGSGLAGGLLHGKRHGEANPSPGSVSPNRHHHIQAPAAH
ncbi:MAG TPA: hypothetical protein VHV31_14130 [Nitrolancea sp.]|nr:hypothetical protein [Nitrolancea sp.]